MNPSSAPPPLHRARSFGKQPSTSSRRPSREWSNKYDQQSLSRSSNIGGMGQGQGYGRGGDGYGREGQGARGEGYERGEGPGGDSRQAKRSSRKYEGSVVDSITTDPNSHPSYATLLRDFSTLRIRSQHLQSLLQDSQTTITRQSQEITVLRHALSDHQHQSPHHDHHSSTTLSEEPTPNSIDAESELTHLRSLVQRRDRTITALTATIMSLRAELGAVTLNKAELSSEVKLLRARLLSLETSNASGSISVASLGSAVPGSTSPLSRPRAMTVGESPATFVAGAGMQPGPWMSLTTPRVGNRWDLD
ncbi:hypothetical protein HK097_009002, partial [Rhizophlyctis rosea]